ncbi:hypothetical protein SODALDRAFT_353155 [Sodiomyces alkalinus F11]|uniref:Zn(2)-C6 fungal-type domain-containing protein n=1 Tax=Sodiomyces alkalinus (strain CBS 110278 / VKM F-3762 / F11) TaxID=1314773 RepID=A0A3N2PM33_SODAK|nr:hypothetical protein SODALDRAFT_353155 [Sodiomyces alkalinus F11]ROT35470.1 hypothetical protein SODALDRAFT_353155 [Sodiomyces alkalinus F11]
MSKRFREILPASSVLSTSEKSPSAFRPSSLTGESGKRKRITTHLACNACRGRKTRCDGNRPICGACQKRSTECLYVDKHDKELTADAMAETLELVELLKTLPEAQAVGVLRLLRLRSNPSSVLSDVPWRRDGTFDKSLQSVASPAQWTMEYELMSRNPVSYPALKPRAASSLEEIGLDRLCPLRRTSSSTAGYGYEERNSTSDLVPPASGSDQAPPTYCDERLRDLDVAFWTDVPIDPHLAARIISLYLETDHPLIGTFDPSMFVADLINRQSTFCSSFLVNAIMSWGSQMYSSIDSSASQYVDLFCDETERLWKAKSSSDDLPTLAGAQLLGLAYQASGRNHLVLGCFASAYRMGVRMCLFGVEPEAATKSMEEMPEHLRRPASYAAWGIFNWIVLTALFYQQPGLVYPEYPPVLPIPGARDEATAFSQEMWVEEDRASNHASDHTSNHISNRGALDYAADQTTSTDPTLPGYMGETFPALCRFWRIMHALTVQYYRYQTRPPSCPSSRVGLEFAEYKYRELIAWAETLPESLVQSDTSPHHVMVFHIWFHAAILDIFRPFLQRPGGQGARLKTFSSRDSSPDATFAASVNQLKRLILVYRLRYASSAYSILWHTGLTYLANAVLHDTEDSEWYFYFLVCVYGYQTLRRSYRLAEAVGRGLLSMALRDGNISAGEARRILQDLKNGGLSEAPDDMRATFMIDLELASTNPDEAKVEALATQFDDLALFQDFTNNAGEPFCYVYLTEFTEKRLHHPNAGKCSSHHSTQREDVGKVDNLIPIEKAVASAPVVLFMKGTPETPQCGFSRASIQVLGLQGVDPAKFAAFNVLEDPELRSGGGRMDRKVIFGSVLTTSAKLVTIGIKEFSDWPTIPQLYVDKEFVGGCDILVSMHQNGELAKLLEEKKVLAEGDGGKQE